MLLEERGLLGQVEIVASDLSSKALARARGGRYGKRSVRRVPRPELQSKFLTEVPDGFTVPTSLVERVQWKSANLLSDRDIAALGEFDVILCRNVLIYFGDDTIRGVLGRLSSALRPNGWLLVGVSESLLRYGSAFQGEERGGTFVYRKPAGPGASS